MTLQQNFDAAEIAKFDALAHDWWNPTGSMKLLHQLNPLRLQYILQQSSLSGKTVLDVGCGAGILTEAIAQQNAHVTGIDLAPSSILAAQKHAQEANLKVKYECIATEIFAEKNPHQFDIVVCMELLEHVPNPLLILEACRRLLKPSGLAIFSTINRTPLSFITAIAGAEYILQALPKGTHHYQQFIRPSELTQWAAKAQLSLRHLQGINYNPLTQKFSFIPSVKVNYIASFEAV